MAFISSSLLVVNSGLRCYGGLRHLPLTFMMDVDGHISSLYNIGNSQAAYFIIDPSQVLIKLVFKVCNLPCSQIVRARMGGVRPVVVDLSMKQLMRHVRSLQLAFAEEERVNEEERMLKVSIMLLFSILVIDTDILMYSVFHWHFATYFCE